MKLLSPASCVCVLSMALGGCQSIPMPDIQAGLNSLDFNLDSASYVVRAGETLDTIAFRYNVSVATLRELNPDAANGVYTGMYLNIRPPVGSARYPTRQTERAAAKDLPNHNKVNSNNNAVQTTPILRREAVPIAALATDQYLLNDERYNRSAPELARSQEPENRSTGYVQQPGFPVEEVIDDINFVLPNSGSGVDEELSQFVGGWQWPLNGQLARDYDPQRANGRGIEIVGLPGQQVFATRDGVVDWVARSPDGVGKVVIVRHDDDFLSIYSNAQDLFVSMKDTVSQGDPIASLGANVNDEPLLRFEISKNGNLLNPMDFLSPR